VGVPLGRDVCADGGQSRFRVADIIARSGASFGVHGTQDGARLFSHLGTCSESVDKVLLWLRHWLKLSIWFNRRAQQSRVVFSVGSHCVMSLYAVPACPTDTRIRFGHHHAPFLHAWPCLAYLLYLCQSLHQRAR